ncbi:MAG TPA: NADH-quinone oxidoreductase subunit B [Candidatus Binatia bacterium]|nr:NADH-quinone oxidoreductase subunit B [Candidatus Binatia bacterium]
MAAAGFFGAPLGRCLCSGVRRWQPRVCLTKKKIVVCRRRVLGISTENEAEKAAVMAQTRSGDERLLSETVVLTRLDKAIGWARKYSLFPYPFATACCAMEYMSLSMSPYDIDRFGALLPRFSPRQADLLMVIGTVNHKLSPVLKRVYEQMSEPKWVMAFGACAASGGFYDNYATVQGIDRIIPVDVYVPGCPPRPEAVLDGLMELQKRIASQKHPLV